jgi:uncharacterized protein YcfJ
MMKCRSYYRRSRRQPNYEAGNAYDEPHQAVFGSHDCSRPKPFIQKALWFSLIGFLTVILIGPVLGVVGVFVGLAAAMVSLVVPLLPFLLIGWIVSLCYRRSTSKSAGPGAYRGQEIRDAAQAYAQKVREAAQAAALRAREAVAQKDWRQEAEKVWQQNVAPAAQNAANVCQGAVSHLEKVGGQVRVGAGRVRSFIVEAVSGAILGGLFGWLILAEGHRHTDADEFVLVSSLVGGVMGGMVGLSRFRSRPEGNLPGDSQAVHV